MVGLMLMGWSETEGSDDMFYELFMARSLYHNSIGSHVMGSWLMVVGCNREINLSKVFEF